jgi:hypothetical protein
MSTPFLGMCALISLVALLQAGVAVGQSASSDQGVSANELARAVVANEIKAQEKNQRRWMYRVDREEHGKTQTKEVVQTARGSLDRLVAVDGYPLNPKEQQEESDRLQT